MWLSAKPYKTLLSATSGFRWFISSILQGSVFWCVLALRYSYNCPEKKNKSWTMRTEYTVWMHQMGTVSALLALCGGNPSVTVGFPNKGPVTRALMFYLMLVSLNFYTCICRFDVYPFIGIECVRLFVIASALHYTLHQRSWGGYAGFTFSVHPSLDRTVSALYH